MAPLIQVESLAFHYQNGKDFALRGLSFAVEEGEIFGFLGPSGAGKSTTQNILIKVLGRYQGRVCVLGKDLERWGHDYYEQIGVSFEFPNHYLKLSALENLSYFGSLYGNRNSEPQALLDRVGLLEDRDVPVGQYSKGMKTRLSVARSFLHKPRLVFLDEPTGGMDPVNARRIRDLVREERRQGRTFFLTTHDMTVADELCDRVAFITQGSITAIDSPKALKQRYGQPQVRIEHLEGDRLRTSEFPIEGLHDNQAFLRVLQGGSVRTIHSQEASLEEVFVQVTGRSLS